MTDAITPEWLEANGFRFHVDFDAIYTRKLSAALYVHACLKYGYEDKFADVRLTTTKDYHCGGITIPKRQWKTRSQLADIVKAVAGVEMEA